MKILVTGGTGFIGGHFIRALIESGLVATVLKRETSRVNDEALSDRITWVTIDSEIALNLKVSDKFDVIVNLATSYNRSGIDYVNSEMSNVIFPLALIDFALKSGCSYFINIDTFSSDEKYDNSHLAEYNLTKQNFLRWARLICSKNVNFNFVNARLQHVYGPGDRDDKFVPMIVNRLLKNIGGIDLTSCCQRRDFIYVSDVTSALLAIIFNKEKIVGFKEIDVGSGFSVPLKEFLKKAKQITKSKTKLNYKAVPQRDDEIMNSVADIEYLRSLGWRPEIPINKGISLTVNGHLGIISINSSEKINLCE